MEGARNMALDVALMARARRTGETVLRIYGWSTPTLSFGRNQRAADAYDAESVTRAGLDVVRRPTGGRALLHDREITYSVTAPADGSLGAAYHRINLLLLNALESLGVPTEIVAPASRSALPSSTPCFAEPAAGELSARGRKLVGSAQWRDAGALLQHGSILVDDDQGRIADVMREPPVPVPPPATLNALLGRAPSAEEMGTHLLASVRSLADIRADWFDVEPDVLADAERQADQFRNPGWTWRR